MFRKKAKKSTLDTSVSLVLSDLHIPYQHPDALSFIDKVVDYYKPTYNSSVGDELDFHDASFHDSETILMSSGQELKAAKPIIKDLESIIPQCDFAKSNHGTMLYRKAKAAKIPDDALKPYNELYGVGDGWQWHSRIVVDLPNKQKLCIRHNKSKNTKVSAMAEGMNYAQGHYHSTMDIQYYANEWGMGWGMTVGCLIDDQSFAFAYNKTDKERPCLGVGMVIDGHPLLIPMHLNSRGRWDKRLLKI